MHRNTSQAQCKKGETQPGRYLSNKRCCMSQGHVRAIKPSAGPVLYSWRHWQAHTSKKTLHEPPEFHQHLNIRMDATTAAKNEDEVCSCTEHQASPSPVWEKLACRPFTSLLCKWGVSPQVLPAPDPSPCGLVYTESSVSSQHCCCSTVLSEGCKTC